MQIDLLRHGECSDQAWLRGRVDSALSQKGRLQMQAALNQLTRQNRHYDKIICSPAQRCQLCDQAGLNLQTANVSVSDNWQERNFGVLDGLSFQAVEQQYPTELQAYLNAPFTYAISKAECFEIFQNRIYQAWSNLIQTDNDSVLIVTHGGPMRLVLQHVLGLSNQQLFNLQLGYAARLTIEVFATDSTPFCKLVELVQIEDGE